MHVGLVVPGIVAIGWTDDECTVHTTQPKTAHAMLGDGVRVVEVTP
jgi:hypothetical protein